MSILKALAAVAAAATLPASVTASPLAPQWEHPIGRPEVSTFKFDAAAWADAPVPQLRTYSADSLGNATEAPASGVASPEARMEVAAVPDTRFLHTNTVYPFLTTGKIQWSNGVWCSGALIGPRLVATAKHCSPQNGEQVSIRFSPGFDQGEKYGGAYVTTIISLSGSSSGDCGVKDDWAVFVIDSYLGNSFGYMGAAAPVADASLNVPMWWTQGYPGDRESGTRPYATQNIRVTGNRGCDAQGPLIADAYVSGGQSGSAFWYFNSAGAPVQHGIASVTEVNHNWSGWASGVDFVNAVIAARRDFP